MTEIHMAQKPFGAQEELYCPYDKTPLYFVWKDGHIVSLGLTRHLFCKECKTIFALGLYGFSETDYKWDVEIKELKKSAEGKE